MRPALAAAVAVILVVLVVAAPAQASHAQTCAPTGLFTGKLKVKRVGCHKARRIVGKFFERSQTGVTDTYIRGFHCVGKNSSGGPIIHCRKHRRRIRYRGALG